MALVDLGPNFAAKVPSEALQMVGWIRIEPTPPIPPNAPPPGSHFHLVIRFRDHDAALQSREFSELANCRTAYDQLAALISG